MLIYVYNKNSVQLIVLDIKVPLLIFILTLLHRSLIIRHVLILILVLIFNIRLNIRLNLCKQLACMPTIHANGVQAPTAHASVDPHTCKSLPATSVAQFQRAQDPVTGVGDPCYNKLWQNIQSK